MATKVIEQLKKSSIFLMLFLVIIQVFTALLWFINIPITKLHLPIEFLICCMIFITYNLLKNKKSNKKEIITKSVVSIIIAGIVFTFSVICATYFYDSTPDGNTYHKVAVGSMKNGWIPNYGSTKDFTEENGNVVTLKDGNRNYLWADHYANGTEIIGANIYKLTNRIEAGKAFNMVMIYIGFGILLSILVEETKLGTLKSVFIAVILTVNPITINQMWTFYVDTTLLIGLFITLAELISITKKRRFEKFFILFMALILCIESKFTGAAYAAIFCFAFFVYWLISDFKNKNWKNIRFYTMFYIILIITSVLIIGFATYFMNFIKYKSFFYPLYGVNHVENMVNEEIPVSLAEKPNFIQFLISVFAKGENISAAYLEQVNEPKIKIPLTFDTEELENYTIPDIRAGGFGPLFSAGYILGSLMGLAVIIKFIKEKRIKESIPFLIITAISYLLLIMLNGGYWARYVPYIYFVQILNLVFFIEEFKIKKGEVLVWLVIAIFTVNSWLVFNVSVRSDIRDTRETRKLMTQFCDYAQNNKNVEITLDFETFLGVQYNLDDIGIRVKISEENTKKERRGFLFTY